MEAGATAHHWGRQIAAHNHKVRLIQPVYVKPLFKRQRNDANGAKAASRPTMRFVPVKAVERQAHGTLFRGRNGGRAMGTEKVASVEHLAWENACAEAKDARRNLAGQQDGALSGR